jgi:multiple sugar transport system substrate-binding protein
MLFTRKSIIAMVMLSFLVVLSACNSGGKEKSASPSANPSVNLGITWWGGQARHDATLKAIDLYNQRNPGATFEPTYMDNATYLTKLATLAAAKTLPDIMQTDITYLAEYASRGMLADISTGINLNDVDQKFASSGVLNGNT